jgi:hypothetical protein
MPHTVFFSWQIDTPPRSGRNFIERALRKVLVELASTPELEEAVRDDLALDKDTKGIAGQPPIAETIFKKIDAAAVFVPDLTFVGTRKDGRPTPNPNVLIEYGWALKGLSHGRIVGVMNTAHGEPTAESMPFDMRHLRYPICYCLSDDADAATRKDQLDKLAKALATAIQAVLESEEFKAALPRPPAPSPFPAATPMDGHSRFRPRGKALGSKCDPFSGNVQSEVRLHSGASLWLRVMPVSDSGKTFAPATLMRAAQAQGILWLMPIISGAAAWDFLRAADGAGMYPVLSSGEDTRAVGFVFRTGEVWAIDTYALDPPMGNRSGIPLVEAEMSSALKRYASFINLLGIQPPYRWIGGMEGIQGKGIYIPSRPNYASILGPQGACLSDVVVEEGQYDLATSAGEALLPFFRKLFEECGSERPDYLPVPN